MTLDEFWKIIDKVHRTSREDMDEKCELLELELRQLPLSEVLSFHAYFDECIDRAYSWPLWAAAYIMGGGCSDDGFSDFRSTLISMGRDTFERALSDPQSLADLDLEDGDEMQYEGYQYVPMKVKTDLSGGQDFPRSRPHPSEPSGEPWDESAVDSLFPRLVQRYGYEG